MLRTASRPFSQNNDELEIAVKTRSIVYIKEHIGRSISLLKYFLKMCNKIFQYKLYILAKYVFPYLHGNGKN